MKTYKYGNGSMIEVSFETKIDHHTLHSGEVLEENFKTYSFFATARNSRTRSCSTWEEATNFLSENTKSSTQK
jgi:hypothetical protein